MGPNKKPSTLLQSNLFKNTKKRRSNRMRREVKAPRCAIAELVKVNWDDAVDMHNMKMGIGVIVWDPMVRCWPHCNVQKVMLLIGPLHNLLLF